MEALSRLAAEPARAAVFLDIDGVLAPIVSRPEEAAVSDELRLELHRLAGRYALVACVTGRPSSVARELVGVAELTYVGEHGLELEPEAAAWTERIRAFAEAAGWQDVEQKPLSVAFHYREAGDPAKARARLEAVAQTAAAEGFRTRFGRMVLEVLPPVDATKGTAVRRLLSEHALRCALYAGDDTTDLDGFAALDRLDVAVRVAVASPEAPAALVERADIVLDSQQDVLALLRRL